MRFRNTFPMLLCLTALASTGAQASDIQCATTRQPAERVICDHAILNNEYDDIVAQQQAMLGAGKLSAGQLAQWRQARNACTDVHCIDTVFAQWKAMAKPVAANGLAAQAPAMASATALAPVGPTSDAYAAASMSSTASAALASPTSEASLVRQGSAAGVALPQPVDPPASSASEVAQSASSAAPSAGGSGSSAGWLVLVAVAVALGAFVYRRKRRDGTR
ncbi:cobalamin biosynthesis Mg chelatase CobN [Paraburkholderia sp. GAS199]|uniref:hypothetical protein n=1 Tax=Paraburkholderia sp. GAS199 TaxID=3035126 RepID=UPI003D1CDFC0